MVIFIHGKTMYIAGSHTSKDWYDDDTKVPDWGDLRQSTRYQAATKALKENPQATHVVGHSLGGSVALQLEKISQTKSKQVELTALLYWMLGRVAIQKDIDIMLTLFLYLIDPPICLLTLKKTTSSMSLTHDYSEMAGEFTSTEEKPAYTENPEGKSSIG